MSAGRRIGAAVAARSVTALMRAALEDHPPGGQQRWLRTNHRCEDVSMLEGPAVAVGLVVGALVASPDRRAALATTIATSAGGVFGVIDDLAEDTEDKRKGLRGHLGALAHGRLTTGGLKVLGIGVGALVAAAVATPAHRTDGSRRSAVGWGLDVATSGALIATSANLVNLLDLRPGRALKAATIAAAPVSFLPGRGGSAASAVLGASAAAADQDLAETDMLGDGGANALGAALGTSLVLSAPRPVRLGALAITTALTVASERVSFTRVIESTPVLRDLDRWGRRRLPPPSPRP
ncbi:hypothetical protein [Cellulomonas composti]|uniref:Glycosyl transferase family 4 n=1 Tax=Cellulomonas composti TaxID=266130 RepID=A0A511J5U5_9CELL|nr:hypothetical protein [Cellulomonas composti]GEL93351.1 hypothetical protein CCO02nite_00090 [Cellulomonas composti]